MLTILPFPGSDRDAAQPTHVRDLLTRQSCSGYEAGACVQAAASRDVQARCSWTTAPERGRLGSGLLEADERLPRIASRRQLELAGEAARLGDVEEHLGRGDGERGGGVREGRRGIAGGERLRPAAMPSRNKRLRI